MVKQLLIGAGLLFFVVVCASRLGGGTVPNVIPSVVDPYAAIKAQYTTKLLDSLYDGKSARFRNVTLRTNAYGKKKDRYEYHLCGEVNAKNLFGGYTGFQWFVVWKTVDGQQINVTLAKEVQLIVTGFCKEEGALKGNIVDVVGEVQPSRFESK